jgi:hypothetical protein
VPGRELLAEHEENAAKLLALSIGESGEELVFGVALCLRGAFELPFTGSGKGDDVPAAADEVLSPCGQAFD